MDNPLVSVIVPAYQVEEYLAQCVQSILDQTHRHIEVILVDDGSTDGSGDICDAFADRDPRVRVIHQANAGLSAARNAGLERARGSHIAYVDGDDAVDPCFLQGLLQADCDVALCAFTRDESNLSSAEDPEISYHEPIAALGMMQEDATGEWTVAWNKLYRRELFGAGPAGDAIRFPVGRQHEDEFTTYKLLWRASSVAYVDAPLYYYRQRPHSIMSSGFSQRSLDAVDALRERVDFYHEAGEERLAVLCEATLAHRIRSLLDELELADPALADRLRGEMNQAYAHVMGSSQVSLAKKAKLSLAIKHKRLYDRLKGTSR